MNNYLTKDILVNALKECNLKQGDIVLVHCNVSALGRIKGTIEDYLKTYHEALQNVLGNRGTIVVPAYYYEYAREKIPFDIKKSPVSKELGLFSKYINGQKNSYRSLNPLTSLAAIGEKAEYICGGKTASAYGVDSGFDRLYKAKAKMAFIGVDCTMTYIHYVEYMVGVPYLYNKYYQIPIYDNGKEIKLPVSGQVRYLDFKVEHISSATQTEKFEKAGIVKKAKVGNGYIRVVSFEDTFKFLKTKLQNDFFYLLKSKPNFIKNKVPLI